MTTANTDYEGHAPPEAESARLQLIPIQTVDDYELLANSPLQMDDLARKGLNGEEGYSSILDGISFNGLFAMEAYYLPIDGEPAAIVTLAVAPRWWMSEQKLLVKKDEVLTFHTMSSLLGEDAIPDYAIIPRWTKVADSYLGRFAIPGYRFFSKRIKELTKQAPQNTWLYAVAQGHYNIRSLPANIQPGTVINAGDFQLNPELVGENYSGSTSSVKFALSKNMERIPKVGVFPRLGPAFYREVK